MLFGLMTLASGAVHANSCQSHYDPAPIFERSYKVFLVEIEQVNKLPPYGEIHGALEQVYSSSSRGGTFTFEAAKRVDYQVVDTFKGPEDYQPVLLDIAFKNTFQDVGFSPAARYVVYLPEPAAEPLEGYALVTICQAPYPWEVISLPGFEFYREKLEELIGHSL